MDLMRLIDLEMQSRGIRKFRVEPIFIDINKALTIIDLNKYIYLFCSEVIDTKIHTVVNLTAPDNSLRFNKILLEQMRTQYKFFSEELTIAIEHYGRTLTPFRLEFFKIIPEREEDEKL